jgi:hypothetical protein
MAIIGAVKKVFPGAQIIGCLFHLYQNWRKQLRKVGKIFNQLINYYVFLASHAG